MSSSLSQRIAGTGAMNVAQTHSISQLEQGTSIKSYQAVDALSFDLVERMLGSAWIRENKYVPFSVFDLFDYQIDPKSFIACIPYHDSFRARFWAIMAHELAHVFVYESTQATRNIEIISLLWDFTEPLVDEFSMDFTTASRQLTELFSDIIGTYVCPATFVTSTVKLPYSTESDVDPLISRIQRSTHPPTDCRLAAMKEVLEGNGLLYADSVLDDYVDSSLKLFCRKNLTGLTPSSQDVMEDYTELAKLVSQSLLEVLPHTTVKPMTTSDWQMTRKGLFCELDLPPTFLVNLAWIKRLECIRRDSNHDFRAYSESRKRETQFLENIINSAQKYYTERIASRVSGDIYDLCIDSS
ncbi:MAG TPA: hypothetical protein VE862_10175 [Candidatus Acidoferrum sp.]|nr:hypothetical protein [Candidatus Acidoferrum sp.]